MAAVSGIITPDVSKSWNRMAETSNQPPGSWPGNFPELCWEPPSIDQLQALMPQFEILSKLGQGGMGAVYKARQKSLDRIVAIKVLRPRSAAEDVTFSERFHTEACLMAKLMHPGIVSVFEFGETAEGQSYLVMEFVDGVSLAKMILARGKLDESEALAVTAHVCDALGHAHSQGVVHRDINPANILVTNGGQVKVADFGIAGLNDSAQTTDSTEAGIAIGTPGYAAPEALHSTHRVDSRADLYAVGVMLYHMLTGEMPGADFTVPSVCSSDGQVDPRFDAIVATAVQINRDVRYQRASEIRRDLDAIASTPRLPRAAAAACGGSQAMRPSRVCAGKAKPAARRGVDRALFVGTSLFAASLVAMGIAELIVKPTSPVDAISPGPARPALPVAAEDPSQGFDGDRGALTVDLPKTLQEQYLQALNQAFADAPDEHKAALQAELDRLKADLPIPGVVEDSHLPDELKRLRAALRQQLAHGR